MLWIISRIFSAICPELLNFLGIGISSETEIRESGKYGGGENLINVKCKDQRQNGKSLYFLL